VKLLEHFQAIIRGEAEPPAVSRLVGFRMTEAGEGTVTFELEVDERHTSPPGSAHGGILCDVADAAMGCAYGTLLDDSETWTTVELKINYLRPAWPGARLRAEGRVVNSGRTLALTECDVVNGEGKLVARASSTVMRLTRSPAVEPDRPGLDRLDDTATSS
jgi:uncharacterized protein (TIGR00369 family)